MKIYIIRFNIRFYNFFNQAIDKIVSVYIIGHRI